MTNSKLYKLITSSGAVAEVGDLGTGPGVRSGLAMAYVAKRAGKLLIFGGEDVNGVAHTDVWEYDLENESWGQRVSDCDEASCPSAVGSLLLANAQGLDVSVLSTGRTGSEMSYVIDEEGEWIAASSLAEDIPAQDCDGDGELDPESSMACSVSDLWYAPVGRQMCAPIGVNEDTVCLADAPADMSQLASWSPDGWEWIVDMAAGEKGYTYILADSTVYTFDALDAAWGLTPLNADDLEQDFGFWSGPDWGFDAEVVNGYLYVGAWSGVHVFSLEDPEDPVEVGYVPSYAPVLDMASLEASLYLADGLGITLLDISDPTSPVEAKRVSLGGKLAMKVGVDMETRGLVVLTPTTVERFDVNANASNPVFSARRC